MRVFVSILLFTTSALAVDCTLVPETPANDADLAGPLRLLNGNLVQQDETFSTDLSIAQGAGPLVLEFEYCGDVRLEGDFSEIPFWEFGAVRWRMIQNPALPNTLIGNMVAPTFDLVYLPDLIQETTVELTDSVFRTTGVFDTRELEPGNYVIGLTGAYILAEPSPDDPDRRLRFDVMFEYGFPLTVVPIPEPSSGSLVALGLITTMSQRRHCAILR